MQRVAHYGTVRLTSNMDITRVTCVATETQKNVLKPQGHRYNKQTGHNPHASIIFNGSWECGIMAYRMARNFGRKIFWQIAEIMTFGGIYFGA